MCPLIGPRLVKMLLQGGAEAIQIVDDHTQPGLGGGVVRPFRADRLQDAFQPFDDSQRMRPGVCR